MLLRELTVHFVFVPVDKEQTYNVAYCFYERTNNYQINSCQRWSKLLEKNAFFF